MSGAITFEETLFAKSDDGTPFVELLKREGIIAGIKVDKVRLSHRPMKTWCDGLLLTVWVSLRSVGLWCLPSRLQGVKPIMGTDGETVTQGLTDLGARCAKYYEAGARFAKWFVPSLLGLAPQRWWQALQVIA